MGSRWNPKRLLIGFIWAAEIARFYFYNKKKPKKNNLLKEGKKFTTAVKEIFDEIPFLLADTLEHKQDKEKHIFGWIFFFHAACVTAQCKTHLRELLKKTC